MLRWKVAGPVLQVTRNTLGRTAKGGTKGKPFQPGEVAGDQHRECHASVWLRTRVGSRPGPHPFGTRTTGEQRRAVVPNKGIEQNARR